MVILYVIALALAFPAGYLLAYLARDELKAGKRWFMLLAVLSLISSIVLSFTDFSLKFPAVLTLFFIAIISLMALWKSSDKKWTK
ncbi:hypothetical protein A3K73_02445 [Candidatus Pacearchaeota archaeon RBG_13_36_9]|nr:MAG: hypothetical protein A3K73_02445 [Candidatus Pacearchaeota archaeon RBG_13_36_9]